MASKGISFTALLFFLLLLTCCRSSKKKNATVEDVAANEEVARYMKAFERQGEQPDGSLPVAPGKALAMFRHPDDLKIDLVLAEPGINQPVFINFDHRGRLWVVQYNQYPYPAGLKVTSIDNHDRVTFDKVPEPPPGGVKGADKISFFEDTDGDGTFDKSTDAITGLNIATSVTLGRGKIWVLSPPYLLAYPDADGDGIPDGSPEVVLKGFGIEDTHAVANSLRWGPDGWLYGAQGSTVTSNINSAVSKNISFSGQAIWRYDPDSRIFEVFAEGGGNTFYIEMDDKGRVFSGDNGIIRGLYFKQGGYYFKNWGKHGALTNPYALGWLPGMGFKGDSLRFTHGWLKYQGDNLPERYQDAMIAMNPLHGYLQLTRFEPNGSNFNNVDEERIIETADRWFRPVDIKTGPDGAVYIADWYDSRLSHVDPTDNWDKSSGRIYRLYSKNGIAYRPGFDLSKYSGDELIKLLSEKNRWFREEALRQFADRKDKSLVPALTKILTADTGQLALEALWAIHLSGGFDDSIARTALLHSDPFVRMWCIRLLGDNRNISPGIASLLEKAAAQETNPETRGQLACTAKRLPAPVAIPIIKNLLLNHDDSQDPDMPMLTWWALESKAETGRKEVLDLFNNAETWKRATVKEVIIKRLMQRYAMGGGEQNLLACARLLSMAPGHEYAKILIAGLQEGLEESGPAEMPAALTRALKPYQKEFNSISPVLALRQGGKTVLEEALAVIAGNQADIGKRLAYIRALGEVRFAESVPALLRIADDDRSTTAVIKAALESLQSYDDPQIGLKVLAAYPYKLRAFEDTREAALSLVASRATWANQFLRQVGNGKVIHKTDIPMQIVQRFSMLNDTAISAALGRLWPELALTSAAGKNSKIAYISALLKPGGGDTLRGKVIFSTVCGSCHRLFSAGGSLGPDLTGYDRNNTADLLRNIIDPNAFIREGYVYYHLLTTDGRSLTGKVLDRRGKSVGIQLINGQEITLNSSQVKEMKALPGSIMPERLMDGLNDQQVKDLFSYIRKK
ncbi:MAG: c-type cytochrome [Bacteroidota bacterium]